MLVYLSVFEIDLLNFSNISSFAIVNLVSVLFSLVSFRPFVLFMKHSTGDCYRLTVYVILGNYDLLLVLAID